ncbi:hypothetical protein HHI36_001018 [Cryptolaemus montrouzieri]|uniref:N-acetyltransferase domain-containing protein n=1 Tax=Cryptolaemus montrouzieri TaxID=559131 RepID=A0ABD2P6A8_9CUCU
MEDKFADDILEEIRDEDLPELAKIYEEYKREYPYIISTVRVGIEWKKSKENGQKVIFLSPRSSWREDGTVIAIFTCSFVFFKKEIEIMQYNCCTRTSKRGQPGCPSQKTHLKSKLRQNNIPYYQFTNEADVILCTLQESLKNLYDGIRYTRRKQFDQEMNFYSTHDKFTDLVRKACEDRNMKNTLWIKSMMVRLPIEVALNYKITCPPEVYIERLKVRDAPQINSVWPRKYDGSEFKVSTLIELNGGIGVYLKKNDKLVAWVLRDQMGQVAILQTHDDYKKNGYASLVTKILSKELAEEGIYPFAGINVKNTASLNMFNKIGYEQIGLHTYFFMAPDMKNKL